MAVCEQCGSIQLVRARSGLVDQWLTAVAGRKPFTCRRCGWRGRRNWTQADIPDPNEYGSSHGATPDPALSVLDAPAVPQPVSRSKKKPAKKKKASSKASGDPAKADFDLAGLEWVAGQDSTADHDATPPSLNVTGWDERVRGIVQQRQRRSQRRQLVGTIAMSALALFLFSLLSFSRGCGGDAGSGL